MTGLGYGEKNTRRAYVFRTAPDSCRKRAVPTLTFSARCGRASRWQYPDQSSALCREPNWGKIRARRQRENGRLAK